MEEQSLRYLTEKLNKTYGSTLNEKIMSGYRVNRRTTLRVNTLKTTQEKIETTLSEKGIAFQKPTWFSPAIELLSADESAILALPEFEKGEVYLQSLSSMLPPLFLDVKAGQNVLDMAAAPGGKTTQMAAMSENKANITACERNKNRAEKLKYNLQKQGATRVNVMVTDARELSDFFAFDRILLDAPCSGSGTVDLNDENARAEYNDLLLKKITSTQLALLKKGIKLLKKGQYMVYSTCSIFKEENENILSSVLKEGSVSLVPIEKEPFSDMEFLPSSLDGVLTVCPNERYEGFFIAKLQKN